MGLPAILNSQFSILNSVPPMMARYKVFSSG
jgi:hypothetical protein